MKFGDIKHFLEQIPTAGGGLTLEDARELFALSSELPGAVGLEIGSWKGRSTGALAAPQSKTGGTLYCVDPWMDFFSPKLQLVCDARLFQAWRENVTRMGLDGVAIPRKGASIYQRTKWPEKRKLDFLFIDGMHNYRDTSITLSGRELAKYAIRGWKVNGTFLEARPEKPVTLPVFGAAVDFAHWAPLIKTGGYLAMHDIHPERWPGVTRVWREQVANRPDRWKVISLNRELGIARRVS